jgi:hypothetical protein
MNEVGCWLSWMVSMEYVKVCGQGAAAAAAAAALSLGEPATARPAP